MVQHDCYISTRSMTKRVKTCKNASIVPPVTSTTVSVILSRPGASHRARPAAGRPPPSPQRAESPRFNRTVTTRRVAAPRGRSRPLRGQAPARAPAARPRYLILSYLIYLSTYNVRCLPYFGNDDVLSLSLRSGRLRAGLFGSDGAAALAVVDHEQPFLSAFSGSQTQTAMYAGAMTAASQE